MLLEAEEKLSSQTESTKKKKGGRMDSPHTVAQGRSDYITCFVARIINICRSESASSTGQDPEPAVTTREDTRQTTEGNKVSTAGTRPR